MAAKGLFPAQEEEPPTTAAEEAARGRATAAAGGTLANGATLLLADAFSAVACTALAIVLRRETLPALPGIDAFAPVRDYVTLWPALLLLLLGRAAVGLYPGYGLHPAEELRRQTWVTVGLFAAVLAGGALFSFATDYSRIVLVLTALLLLVVMPTVRAGVQGLLARSGRYGAPIWVLGDSEKAHDIARLLVRHPTLGLRPVGIGTELPGTQLACRQCLVVPDALGDRPIAEVLDLVNERFERVWLVPELLDVASVWVTPRDLQGHLALELRNNLLEPRSRVLKRGADIALCLLLLPIALPAMLAIIIWIRASGPGPVVISQERVGKDGQPFRILKFRTMRPDADRVLGELLSSDPEAKAEWDVSRKLRNDPRVTRPGRFLRRSSLDELPQLYNILAGHMSFVGPRPVMPDEVERYGSSAHLYTKVAPGLTGLTQVSGRSELPYDERVRLDTYYVRNWSIWLDLVILGRTLSAVVAGRGAF